MMLRIAVMAVLFPVVCFGQLIRGIVTDTDKNTLSGIFIEIETGKQEKLILTTDEVGQFNIQPDESDSITIYINEFGFTAFEEVFTEKDFSDIIEITLQQDETIQLDAADIVGRKPMIKRKLDRLEFNVENTAMQNMSAWEIVRNTPNVMLKNDELTVRGNPRILVTINDKRTLMTHDELKQLLENTDGSNVTSVEVITNPPAKYEASGSAVINIKMKQNVLSGYKGQLYARYHQSVYAKKMLGLSQSYNKNKWQLSGSYYFVGGEYVRYNYDVVTYEENETRWESDMKRKTDAKEQHIYNFASQYTIDSLSSVQFGFNGYNNPASVGNYNVPTNIYNTVNGEIESDYLTQNHRRQFSNSINAYFIYDKKWGENNLIWMNNFSHRYYKDNQDVLTQLNLANQPDENRFANHNSQKIALYSSQIDYSHTKEKWNLESGVKFSRVTNDNNLDFFEFPDTQPEFSPDKSNEFLYDESIFAAYLSSQYTWEKWELKSGLRTETTWINTKSDNPYTRNKTLRTQLFPTLYILHRLDNRQEIGFSYGKRISRPNYNFLNPSKSYYNLFSYFQGDAHMKSTIIHNLNLTYTVKNWNFELYYRYEKDPAMEISIQNRETFETVYFFTNIKNGEAYGANASKNFNFKPWWKMNFFIMGEYNQNYFVGTDEQLYKNDVVFWHLNLNTHLTLDKAETWLLSLGYQYNSPMIQGSFDISSSWNTYLSVNKKFWKKKLEVGLVLNDIFKTDLNTISTNYADQNQSFSDYRDTWYFMLNVKLNFGNQKVKDTKTAQKTDEQERI